MEYSGTWKEIWTQKGLMNGSKADIRVYDGWEKSQTDMHMIADKIINFLNIKETSSVLEVGCGAGGLAQYMDCDYVGIDFSKPLTEKCMEFFQKAAIYGEANNIPFKDKYFDYSFSWGVFLYFPDKEYMEKVVSEMKRVTKKSFFIGECPIKSHDTKHMTYSYNDFEKLGLKVINGWSIPYSESRFNVYWIADEDI